MPYRIALVDDSIEITEELTRYCTQFSETAALDILSVQFNSAEVFLDYFREFQGTNRAFDLIVLDIEMGEIDGMEAARLIRTLDTDVVIIFVTSLVQYAIQGYAVEALDYMVKPVDYATFSFRLEQAFRRYQKKQKNILALPYQKGQRSFTLSELLYIEVQGHRLTYHTKETSFETKHSLAAIEPLLPTGQFAKPNQSFLVNLNHVDAINGQEIMVNGTSISLSRLKKQEFLQALSRFVGGL